MKNIRIALAQIDTTVGDLENNAALIIGNIQRARGLNVDIIAFPELALSGYPPEDILFKRSFLADCSAFLERIAPATEGITALVGYPHFTGSRLYNACAIFHNKRPVNIYHKMHLPNYGVFDEKRYFDSGDQIYVLELGSIHVGVSICEDIWASETPLYIQGIAGDSPLCINISASPFHIGKEKLRIELLRQRAREIKGFIAYVNLVGGQDELIFDGTSLIIDPKGQVLAMARQFEEELLVCDVDLEVISAIRRADPAFLNQQKALEDEAARITFVPLEFDERRLASEKPGISSDSLKRELLEEPEMVYKGLVMGAADYVKKNRFSTAVVGLSGGIDSALTAVIACDALGCENVVGVNMPSRYSSGETQEDTKTLARNLGMRLLTLPIDEILTAYQTVLSEKIKDIRGSLTEENLQARIRGNILMALSNRFGWLVLSTGNKSEVSVGYCTLYGDMAGGFAVIKDLPKQLVYRLARWRNHRDEVQVIPESVLLRPPTAELRPNQKDSDTLPPYEVLDPILEAYVEDDMSYTDIVQRGFDQTVVKQVIQMVDHNEYKRRQAPTGIKITPRAFGRDRRMPITNQYKQF
ncbi:MAG: NAD+ synthase [Candidatus Omnitrophica bacterium]|nr:NAD+ synthase [Candidatus Omnitrophota bacterium]